jgi:7-cyano-7-deazaguanine synthase in queuosine biosynthesis
MSHQPTRVIFACDDTVVPDALVQEGVPVQQIRTHGPEASVDLRIEELYHLVLSEVRGRHADLVRLAAFVYRADLAVSRGGERDSDAWRWNRHLTLCVPVSDPDFWNADAVQASLSATLRFLTGDRWDFWFGPALPENRQIALEISARDLYANPGVVTLFSGGLDSLCTLVESAMKGERPVPLGHWPSPRHERRQKDLIDALRQHNPAWSFPLLGAHIVRHGEQPRETTQRSRGFLFGCLASAVAAEIGAPNVYLADNGPISLNLPINDQLVGALASRATHPQFLARLNGLMNLVLRHSVVISNPLQFRTRPEALGILRTARVESLIGLTHSCSNLARLPAATPQCGGCSQCIDRRFATIAANLEAYDPADRYQQDVFLDVLEPWDRAMSAYSYARFARTVNVLDEDALFLTYMELLDIPPTATMTREACIRESLDLIRRHATRVLEVLASQSAKYLPQLIAGQIPAASLVGKVMQEQPGRRVMDRRPASDAREPSLAGAGSNVVLPISRAEVWEESRPPTFAWRGDGWHVVFAGKEITLKRSVGTERLARLLREPGRAFKPEELDAPVPEVKTREPIPAMLLEGFHIETAECAAPVIDAATVKACNAALEDLEARRVVANDRGDAERAAELSEEMATVRQYLNAATGLRGRIRDEPDPTHNRYRAVRTSIHRTVDVLHDLHRELSVHLDKSLVFDGTCCYRPEEPVTWDVTTP